MFKSLQSRFIAILSLFIFISLTIVTALSSKVVYSTARQFAEIQGAPVVLKVKQHIDGDKYERFLKVMDESDPFYEETRLWMLELAQSVGCKYLFTVSKFGDGYKYVIDGSCDPSDTENFSPLGTSEDVEAWGKAPIKAFSSGKVENSGFKQEDGWGWTISGRILGSGTAYGVDFVDENDAGRLLLGLTEQVADTAGSHTDEHLNKVGTTH